MVSTGIQRRQLEAAAVARRCTREQSESMRRSDEPMPITAADPATDEELSFPSGTWPRRRGTIVVVGLGIVCAGAVAVNEHVDVHAARQSTSPSAIATRVLRSPRVDPRPVDVAASVALRNNPEQCPVTISCLSGGLSAHFLDAAHQLLPTAVAVSSVSVTQTNPLRVYFRQLRATAGTFAVSIRVTRSSILDGLEPTVTSRVSADRFFAFVRVVTSDQYEIEVRLAGPARQHPPISLVRALANNPSLRSIS